MLLALLGRHEHAEPSGGSDLMCEMHHPSRNPNAVRARLRSSGVKDDWVDETEIDTWRHISEDILDMMLTVPELGSHCDRELARTQHDNTFSEEVGRAT